MAYTKITVTVLLIILTISTTTTAISTESLESILSLMRGHRNTLFANAIATSDILFDLLTLPSFTLLAPSDPTLFALDMTQTAPLYVSSLRIHILPNLLRLDHLLSLPDNTSVPTLLPSRSLRVTRDPILGRIQFDGVEVLFPGLYYSGEVAVHGLAGIIPLRPVNPVHPPLPPPFSSHWNRTVLKPVPRQRPAPFTTIIPRIPSIGNDTFNGTAESPLTAENSTVINPRVNLTVLAPVPAHAPIYGYPPEFTPDSAPILPPLSATTDADPPNGSPESSKEDFSGFSIASAPSPFFSHSSPLLSPAIEDFLFTRPVSVSIRLPLLAPLPPEMISSKEEDIEIVPIPANSMLSDAGKVESITPHGDYELDHAGDYVID